MSVSTTTIIPTDPRWVPTRNQEQAAVAIIKTIFGDYRELTVERPNTVELYHGFELFESITCPACSASLDIQPWWTDQLDAAYRINEGFVSLSVTTPCCDRATSLNDLDYRGPLGFASWAVTVTDSPCDLSVDGILQLNEALGHGVRVVYAHM